MANTHDLPQEILVEIFSKLPAKSVGKCRCLSKTWNTYLSTSHFINLHVTSRKTRQQLNLILVTLHKSVEVITSPTKSDQVSREIELPNNWPVASCILGSCNGLVLLSCRKQKLLLNPITHQQVIIPDSALGFWKEEKTFRSYGFGYDHSCNDYKVCTLSRNSDGPHDVIDVYSVRQGVSKRVGYSPFNRPFPRKVAMPFLNDYVHWLTRTESGIRIGAFNLINETFQEVPLPKEFQPDFVYNGLMIFGGCLCIVDYSKQSFIDVWIMKEYGVVDSWVRFSINRNSRWTRFRPVCFVGDEELLAFTGGDSWFVCDLKAESVKEVAGGGISSSNTCDWGSFLDTLVSPDQTADA